jgi:ubiquinone/menaquinone biosynthesis C-methylase UbiE
MLRRIVSRLPSRIQQVLYKGGQRSDRLRDPNAVAAALGLRPGDRVADLGPGYGHFTLLLAQAVAPDGICYAVDADQAVLDDIARAAGERGLSNLRPTLTGRSKLELPESVDLLFVSATYHHIKNPIEYFAGARPLLRPNGRVVILESRLEGLLALRMNRHGSVPTRVIDEMSRATYELTETLDIVRGHWLGVFKGRVRDSPIAV